MTRVQTKINQIVGIKGGELYILEDVFTYSDGFKGATGYSMGTITQEYIDDMNNVNMLCQEYDYIWKDAVQSGATTDSLQDFMQNWVDECSYYEQLFPSDDTSFRYQTETLVEALPENQKKQLVEVFGVMGENFAAWSVSGCGRCFNVNDEWDVVFRPDLIELIKEYEG